MIIFCISLELKIPCLSRKIELDNFSSSFFKLPLSQSPTGTPNPCLDLFKKLESISGERTQVTINWYFEEDDEDMEEAGQDYQAIIGLPFNIIEVEEI